MDKSIKELLLKVLDLCYEISNTTEENVFFHYFPHTNTFDVYRYKEEEKKKGKIIYIVQFENVFIESLKTTIVKLEKFKEEVTKNGTN